MRRTRIVTAILSLLTVAALSACGTNVEEPNCATPKIPAVWNGQQICTDPAAPMIEVTNFKQIGAYDGRTFEIDYDQRNVNEYYPYTIALQLWSDENKDQDEYRVLAINVNVDKRNAESLRISGDYYANRMPSTIVLALTDERGLIQLLDDVHTNGFGYASALSDDVHVLPSTGAQLALTNA